MAFLPLLPRRKVLCPDLWKTPTVSTMTASRLVRSHQGCGLKLRRTVGSGRAKTTPGKRKKKGGHTTLTLVRAYRVRKALARLGYKRLGTGKRPRRGSQLDGGVSPYGACGPKPLPLSHCWRVSSFLVKRFPRISSLARKRSLEANHHFMAAASLVACGTAYRHLPSRR